MDAVKAAGEGGGIFESNKSRGHFRAVALSEEEEAVDHLRFEEPLLRRLSNMFAKETLQGRLRHADKPGKSFDAIIRELGLMFPIGYFSFAIKFHG